MKFPLKRGAWSIKKGAEAREKGVPAECTIPKRTNRVFLRYRLGKYQENTNRYRTEIPNRDATLKKSLQIMGVTWNLLIAVAYNNIGIFLRMGFLYHSYAIPV